MSEAGIRPVIVIHGGAWAIPDQLKRASIDGVIEAARIGYARLVKQIETEISHHSATDDASSSSGNDDGSASSFEIRTAALEAVQLAVESMESNPAFDAGFGSVLNLEGAPKVDRYFQSRT